MNKLLIMAFLLGLICGLVIAISTSQTARQPETTRGISG